MFGASDVTASFCNPVPPYLGISPIELNEAYFWVSIEKIPLKINGASYKINARCGINGTGIVRHLQHF